MKSLGGMINEEMHKLITVSTQMHISVYGFRTTVLLNAHIEYLVYKYVLILLLNAQTNFEERERERE